MALRPAGKTLSSLTGIAVMTTVLWLLLNFVYAPSCGRFACSYVPSWWPQASADPAGAEGCPDSITAAASDAAWAADRIASLRDADAKVTTGCSTTWTAPNTPSTVATTKTRTVSSKPYGMPGWSSRRSAGTR
jgi:hypothetical protein